MERVARRGTAGRFDEPRRFPSRPKAFAQLFYDAQDGRPLGEKLPWTGAAADIFAQAQFPMYSGRIFGLPGRILISLMGLVVAMLSVTGVAIWWRKRRARKLTAQRSQPDADSWAPAK